MRRKSDLRSGQQAVTTELYERDGVLAVVPMGGGKTAATLTAVRELIDDGEIRCALVLAPRRVMPVWAAEVREWEHLSGLRVKLVRGGPAQRKKALLSGMGDIYVVCLNSIPWLCDVIDELPDGHSLLDVLVIDEISKLKNARGVWTKALAKRAERWAQRWGLTGTPRPNGFLDLFGPARVITAGRLWGKSYDKWLQLNTYPADYSGYKRAVFPHRMPELQTDIDSICVTVSKMPDTPGTVPVFHWVELDATARRMYEEMERHLVAKHWDADKCTWISAANAAVAKGKMSQLAQGFMYDIDDVGDRNTVVIHTEKRDYLADMLDGMTENALIAYEFRQDLDVLRDLTGDAPFFGAGVNDRDADRNERDWNDGKLPHLLLHPASAGHGLNLQRGGHQLIWYAMTWSAELYAQTCHRIDRPGQTETCFAHHILARDTVDEVKYDRVVNKLSEEDAFIKYISKRV